MNKNNPQILNEFLDYLYTYKNYSTGTVREYNSDLLVFFRFIIKYLNLKSKTKDITVFILASVKESDIIAFLIYLNDNRENCFRTRQRKISAIRTFYKWLFSRYPAFYNKENPAENIPYIEPTVRLPKFLKLEDAKKLQSIFNKSNSRNSIRNNTIITLFLQTCLRLSELISINIVDIDFEEKSLKITGKGKKQRTIYLNERAITSIKEYLSTRDKPDISGPLFIDNRNKRITAHNIQDICKKAYSLAGLDEYGYTVHTLRHTGATYIYKETEDILILKELLGHKNITSTEIYIHVLNEDIKNAVNSNPLSEFNIAEKAA